MRPNLLALTALITATTLAAAIEPTAQPSEPATPTPASTPARSATVLTIRNAASKDSKSLALTTADFKAMPHRTLTVKDKDAQPITYSGVTVEDILTKAGVPLGSSLKGQRLRDYLLAEATDGYAVVFALPELSADYTDRVVIVADAADNKPLSDKDGPLKIIVSDEKKHARSVRNLTTLTVHTCEKESN